jgi:putative transposase
MPRASRYLLPGYTYHLTQRCHNRDFLLRFAKDRDAYREWLRVGVRRHAVAIYGFNITCNHVHIIAHVDDVESVGAMMQLAAGAGGQQYNRRKQSSGAFWEDTYHCTLVENGRHLWNCLQYVELNMVRAGAVAHPSEWRWSSYAELMGQRQRYRILSPERLLESLGYGSMKELRASCATALAERLARANEREPHWTEALAVGTKAFVCAVQGQYHSRSRFVLEQHGTMTAGETWTVRESREPYGTV